MKLGEQKIKKRRCLKAQEVETVRLMRLGPLVNSATSLTCSGIIIVYKDSNPGSLIGELSVGMYVN